MKTIGYGMFASRFGGLVSFLPLYCIIQENKEFFKRRQKTDTKTQNKA